MKFKTISLPQAMLEKIKAFIEAHPELGYKSTSNFVVSAVRAYPDYRKLLKDEFKEETEE